MIPRLFPWRRNISYAIPTLSYHVITINYSMKERKVHTHVLSPPLILISLYGNIRLGGRLVLLSPILQIHQLRGISLQLNLLQLFYL